MLPRLSAELNVCAGDGAEWGGDEAPRELWGMVEVLRGIGTSGF